MPLSTSKVEDTVQAIQARKEYYLNKRQDVQDGNAGDAEASSSAKTNGIANGDANSNAEEFEHVSFLTTGMYRHSMLARTCCLLD